MRDGLNSALRRRNFTTGKIFAGYHGFGVFDKAVSSCFDNVSEEHGLTEDGNTVPPFSPISVPKGASPPASYHHIFSSDQRHRIFSLKGFECREYKKSLRL